MPLKMLKAMLERENDLRYSDDLQDQYRAAELREDVDWMHVCLPPSCLSVEYQWPVLHAYMQVYCRGTCAATFVLQC